VAEGEVPWDDRSCTEDSTPDSGDRRAEARSSTSCIVWLAREAPTLALHPFDRASHRPRLRGSWSRERSRRRVGRWWCRVPEGKRLSHTRWASRRRRRTLGSRRERKALGTAPAGSCIDYSGIPIPGRSRSSRRFSGWAYASLPEDRSPNEGDWLKFVRRKVQRRASAHPTTGLPISRSAGSTRGRTSRARARIWRSQRDRFPLCREEVAGPNREVDESSP